jgi:hypothetical protein
VAFPNRPDKHTGEPIIVPADVAAPLLAAGELPIPDAAIIAYNRAVRWRLERSGVPLHHGYQGPWRSMWLLPGVEQTTGVGWCAASASVRRPPPWCSRTSSRWG